MENIISSLKKVSFKRNKKDAIIEDSDIVHLKKIVDEQFSYLLSNGKSVLTSSLEIKSSLISRASEISVMNDNYKSYSKKDTYPAFLENLVNLHLSISENFIKY